MAILQGFEFVKDFYDDVHFPMGFKRSGDFTIPEAELLTKVGVRLTQLRDGKVEPVSTEERQFVQMCQHNLKPSSGVERVWAKYQNLITTGKPLFTLNAKAEDVEDDPSFIDDDL